ncbi:MAG: peptidylprolyl isomerase [Myxococcota bacterium]|jgi:peptidylprolyl isomerase
MTRTSTALAAFLAFTAPAFAQEEPDARSSSEAVAQTKTPAPSPNEIVTQAAPSEWTEIPAEDLLVMTLAPDAEGHERAVIIQLMPAPFSQGWVENIRTFARARWYDGITVNRVQDNYVVQWGDVNYDNPEATGEAKPLPAGLRVMGENAYSAGFETGDGDAINPIKSPDAYAPKSGFFAGFPVAGTKAGRMDWLWPVHCYGMVGVGRNLSPDTGSGAELYTVIGQAPRHLDRNIALVGRIVEGMEHLSSLPRGHGELGFYAADEADKRTPILSVRVASDLPEAASASSSEAVGQQKRPRFEYLDTSGQTFARYAEARANRRDAFFIVPAGGADICNIPVPVRRVAK